MGRPKLNVGQHAMPLVSGTSPRQKGQRYGEKMVGDGSDGSDCPEKRKME